MTYTELDAYDILTIKQALAMLPDSDEIPVLMQEGIRQSTTHIPRELIVGAIQTGNTLLTGPNAEAAGYGLAFELPSGNLFIKTKEEEAP